MDSATSTALVRGRVVPLTPTVSELMEGFYQASGIVPPTAREIANLPPWTEEEAAAFERTINETFEQLEETPDHR